MAIKQNGYSNKVRLAKLNKRRIEAEARQAQYDKLSKEQKISLAKSRRGESKEEIRKISKKV